MPSRARNRATSGEPPHLWLVRHGETEWARLGRHTGRTDIPLTALGREQATSLSRRLAGHVFAQVWSSPLSRALDTARIAGFGDRVETDDDLLEWDYGDDEGRTTPEIRADRPGWTIWDNGPKAGELIDDVAARVDRVIARARQERGDVLVFAHGHVLRILGARWIGQAPSEGRLFALATATISELGWEREQPVIERWNDHTD
ncbi:MAG TPA: histidine phosphatase family protein [Candidatus Limnocylindrales bacterium]